jgi:hypothetical protein
MFFFEKKNQKTFEWLSHFRPAAHANVQKFFASFFQKRSPYFPSPKLTGSKTALWPNSRIVAAW